MILAARYRRASRAVVSINRQRGTECGAHLALIGDDHYARARSGYHTHYHDRLAPEHITQTRRGRGQIRADCFERSVSLLSDLTRSVGNCRCGSRRACGGLAPSWLGLPPAAPVPPPAVPFCFSPAMDTDVFGLALYMRRSGSSTKGVLPLTWSFTRCVRYHQDAAAYRGIDPGYWTPEAIDPVVFVIP